VKRGRWRVAPVTRATWPDFVRLFEARGAPHYCWCTPHRFADAHETARDRLRARMHDLVEHDTPIGVLAYEGDEVRVEPGGLRPTASVAGGLEPSQGSRVAGWCSVAPRETYVKLTRSRTMPRVSEAPTWTVLCFFVPRAHRGRGIARALLEGAVRYARAAGAVEIEGYPYDTAGITATHHGHSTIFAAAGFHREGETRRWVRRLAAPRRQPRQRRT
jgi:GNAT superfamily N-acetyltransferase